MAILKYWCAWACLTLLAVLMATAPVLCAEAGGKNDSDRSKDRTRQSVQDGTGTKGKGTFKGITIKGDVGTVTPVSPSGSASGKKP